MTDDRVVRGRVSTAGSAAAAESATVAPEPLEHLAGYAALRAHLVLRECFEQAIGAPMSLRPVEFTLLCRLAAEGPMPAKALAEALAVHAPNLTTIVERLVERGLLSRERNRQDRRSVLIALTPAGRRLQRRALEVSRSMEEERLSALSPAEREQFRALAWRIVRAGSGPG